MDDHVVSLEDMARAKALDARLDLLLAGETPAGDAVGEHLSTLITQINGLVPEPVIAPDMANAHIARIVETLAIPEPPNVAQQRLPRLGWRARLSALAASPVRKIAAAALSVSATFSGLAYAGVLPDPLQRAAADIARIVGVKLPDPDDITSEEPGAGETDSPQSESEGNGPSVDNNGKPLEGTGGSADDDGKGRGDGHSGGDGENDSRNDDSEDDGPSSGNDDDEGREDGSGDDDDSDDSDPDDDSGSGTDNEGSDDEDSDSGSSSDDEDDNDLNDPSEVDDQEPPDPDDAEGTEADVDDVNDDALDDDVGETTTA